MKMGQRDVTGDPRPGTSFSRTTEKVIRSTGYANNIDDDDDVNANDITYFYYH